MSFSDYTTLSQVQIEYQVRYEEYAFVKKQHIELSTKFVTEIDFNMTNLDAFSSEAANSLSELFGALEFIFTVVSDQTV